MKDMVMETLADLVMRDKRGNNGEISVVLFELCNLSCGFCPQNHGSRKGMESIRERLEPLRETIQRMRGKYSRITVNLQGGELFAAEVSNRTMDDYYWLASKLIEESVIVTFSTNLVFPNWERVALLLTRLQRLDPRTQLMVSYDPVGRFSRAAHELFEANVEHLRAFIGAINVTLTKPVISRFLTGNTGIFPKLYEMFPCSFDYYQVEPNKKTNAPTDAELAEVFLRIIDEYPRADPVSQLFDGNETESKYQRTETGGYTVSGFCDVTMDGKLFEDSAVTFDDIENKFITDMGCASCEYLSNCFMGSIHQHWLQPEYRTLSECWLKQVHKEMKRD